MYGGFFHHFHWYWYMIAPTYWCTCFNQHSFSDTNFHMLLKYLQAKSSPNCSRFFVTILSFFMRKKIHTYTHTHTHTHTHTYSATHFCVYLFTTFKRCKIFWHILYIRFLSLGLLSKNIFCFINKITELVI